MRILVIISFVFNCYTSFAQNPISYSDVVNIDSVSKSELFKRGLVWTAEAFRSSNDVIQVKDKEAGMILGKGTFDYPGKDKFYNGVVRFTFKLQFKDGRYKYDFYDFTHESVNFNIGLVTDAEAAQWKIFGSTKKYRDREWNFLKGEVKSNVGSMLITLQEQLSNSVKEDEW